VLQEVHLRKFIVVHIAQLIIIIMVNKSKAVRITTPNVIVNNRGSSQKAAVPSTKVSRRSRRRRRALRREETGIEREIEALPGRLQEVSLLEEMDSGKMTNVDLSVGNFIKNLRDERVTMDSCTEGWYFKYLDPAGSVETGRAIGDFGKIPDGLLTFSVDAEIRTLDTLPVPQLDEEVEVPGSIPLDGKTWSLTIISYPMFRTAYIAVANRFDRELSTVIVGELAFNLNNLADYRSTIDLDTWIAFANDIEEGWYFWIKPLPPTYNLSDPVIGDQRSLTSYRLTYKSITLEHNAPTLIDQGFWIGGHYALDPTAVMQQGQQTEMVPSFIHGTTIVPSTTTAGLRPHLVMPNMPQVAIATGAGVAVPSSTRLDIVATGDISSASGNPITFVMPPAITWYNPFEIVFAEPGDTVTITATSINGITFTSSSVGSTPFVLTFMQIGGAVAIGTEAQVLIYADLPSEFFGNRMSSAIEFPALTPSQVAANNPKMEQFLLKETNGAYIVHRKMRNPVFKVTPAGSFGPVQFTTPGYDIARNTNDGSGILDTFDSNMSTASICVRGIAHANVVVIKLYQGWEGITNVNTPFGQFGHTGLPKNESVLELVDNLVVRTTGVYPANDNFLGLIAKFAAGALKTVLSSQATSGLLGNLAQGVVNRGLDRVNNKLSAYARR